jgi:hypothetical protein
MPMPHSIIHGNACFAYFNKSWDIPDFDASAGEIRDAILPYFRAVKRAFAEPNGLPAYRIGVYGSGAVCQAVLDAQLAELAWLSCSTGWRGYREFLASGRWSLKQHLPTMLAGLDVDPDERNPQRPDIGDFVPGASAPPAPAPPAIIVAPPPKRLAERLLRLLERLRKVLR